MLVPSIYSVMFCKVKNCLYWCLTMHYFHTSLFVSCCTELHDHISHLQDCKDTVLECRGGELQKCRCEMVTKKDFTINKKWGITTRTGTCIKQERAFFVCSKVDDCVSKGVYEGWTRKNVSCRSLNMYGGK